MRKIAVLDREEPHGELGLTEEFGAF